MRRPAAWLSAVALAAATLLAVSTTPAQAATAAATLLAASTTPAQAATAAEGQPGLGLNLSAPVDWTTEWPFVDLFRTSRDWVSGKPGAAYGKGPALSLDADGWVTRLDKDAWAESAILLNELGWYPKGKFVVTWKGQGDVSIWGDGTTSNRTANRFEYELTKGGNHFLRINATTPGDYVRDIHVWLPGFEKTGAEQEFSPQYLQRLRGLTTLRFMGWMNTNNSAQATWDQYPTEHSARQSDGVAPQIMTRLANRLGADPWFTMPHQADDNWVRQFANAVRDSLSPDRKVYVEYSNEVWNSQFGQSRWAHEKGMQQHLYITGWEWQAELRWQAQRSVEIFRIWKEVFGGDNRLVRVLATQAANPTSGEAVLSWKDAYKEADAVAIAPYFTCDGNYLGDGKLTNPGLPGAAAAVLRAGVNTVLDNCQRAIDHEIRDWITKYRALADKYGLALVGYEGGQHLVGILGGDKNKDVNKLMFAANRSSRMRDLYAQYLSQWRELGGGMLVVFASGGLPSSSGSWGLVEFEDQPIAQAPKYLAVDEAMQGLGQRTRTTVAAPARTVLSAGSGLAAGGGSLRISGNNLASTSAVRFGTVRAPFLTTTGGSVTQLTVTVPPSATGGTVAVTVENPAGMSGAMSYTYLPPPIVQKVSTSTASVVGTTEVIVTGTALSPGTAVRVGTTVVKDVKVLSATSIRFIAPVHATGTVDVTVTTPYGTSKATDTTRLTYVNPPRPVVTGLSVRQGWSNTSTTVLVTGTDVAGTTRVVIGKVPATSFVVLSNTQLRVVLPAQPAGTWENISVTTPGGPSFGNSQTDFKYVAPVKKVGQSS
jgi:hypothetical protein